jgi:hypothetical protein
MLCRDGMCRDGVRLSRRARHCLELAVLLRQLASDNYNSLENQMKMKDLRQYLYFCTRKAIKLSTALKGRC